MTEPNVGKIGYRVAGWAKDRDATAADYKIYDYIEENRDMVLYAVWEKNIAETGNIYGDVDLNDNVDFADALYLQRCTAEWNGYTLTDTSVADLNSDGEINIGDVSILERYIAGWSDYQVIPEVA